jgi:hypothetical protein
LSSLPNFMTTSSFESGMFPIRFPVSIPVQVVTHADWFGCPTRV